MKNHKGWAYWDSFVEGACVNENETFAANFDKNLANTISLVNKEQAL